MIPDARRKYSVDEILANSWDRKLARDLADEIEVCTGDKRETVDEMRRFLALKGYRDLLERLKEARKGKRAREALAAEPGPCGATPLTAGALSRRPPRPKLTI
jgi:hypothetical protein